MSLLTLEAKLERQDSTTPWGFRMQGGKDFSSPISIARVTPGSLAAKCGLLQGDLILKIGSKSGDSLKHKDAQDVIVSYGNKLDLLLQRGGAPSYEKFSTPNISSYQTPAGGSAPGNVNYNTAPKPFGSAPTNKPPAPYVPAAPPAPSAVDNVTQQTQNLNIKPDYSKYQEFDDKPGPTSHQSRSFKFLADTLDSGQEPAPQPVSQPVTQPWRRNSCPAPLSEDNNKQVYDDQGKRLYRPSETYKLIHEHENEKEKTQGSKIPEHSRTFKVLEKSLGDNVPPPPPSKAPPAPKPGVWAPGQKSGDQAAPASKPFVPVVQSSGPAKPPAKPTGVGAVRGKIGDAVMKSAGPAGPLSVPVCHSCGSPIRGPFVLAMGKSWCPDHFICANPRCGVKLVDIGFIEEGGFLYCEKDYELYFAPHCAKCDSAIIGECVNALSKQYHPACFLCYHCKMPIGGNQFHLEDGHPYCENDWRQMFQTMCSACNFPIEPGDKWVEALNTNFHSECFNCSTCQVNLEGQAFYAKTGKPYCKKHAR